MVSSHQAASTDSTASPNPEAVALARGFRRLFAALRDEVEKDQRAYSQTVAGLCGILATPTNEAPAP